MKIGIYGGTFDPIHRGHLAAAKAAVDYLHLDQLLLVPANRPPHKQFSERSASAQDRYEMAVLSTAELGKKAQVLDLELRRTGKSYTSDSLRELKKQYPDDELWLLVGTDMFHTLHTWHEAKTILSLAHIGAFSRRESGADADFTAQKARLETVFGAKVAVIPNPRVVEISSTELRSSLACGRGQEQLTEPVWGYIQRRKLYGTNVNLKNLTVDQLRPIALSYLKPKRIPHVLGTECEAVHLAHLYGADEEEARIAALLHDCTKKLSIEEHLALCEQYDIVLDKMQRWALKLQHAMTGAEIARHIFGEKEEICQAIRWHTTGKPDMTLLEKVLYLADYIEPNRDFTGVDELRKTVWEDLDKGLLMGLNMSIDSMLRRGNPVHPDTLAARDFLAQQFK